MAHNVSAEVRKAIFSGASERVFIALVEINHDHFATLNITPIRMTSDGVATMHATNTYESRPFSIRLPDDLEGKQPVAQLQVSNLDARLVQAIRSVTTPLQVTLTIVLDSDTDAVERGPWKMDLVGVSYTRSSLAGTLTVPSLLAEPYPGHTYDVSSYPGL